MSVPAQDFTALASAIADAHARLYERAARAVNTALTVRNWIIGAYIHTYELDGQDRSAYGEQLLDRLSERLGALDVPRTDVRELRRYRLFYQTYPQIWESLTPISHRSGAALLQHLSYTHLVELLGVESSTKRAFYEEHAIAGQWSVRELRRQISSLLYERTAIARDPESSVTPQAVDTGSSALSGIIRDP